MFAARKIQNKHDKYEIPSLSFEGELNPEICQVRFEEGFINQELRKLNAKNSLDVPSPTVGEVQNMHDIFKLCQKSTYGKDFIYQEETKIEKTILMHSQNSNHVGTVNLFFNL